MKSSDEDKLVPLAKAADMLPEKNGKRIHPSTLHRWRNRGVRGVKLRCKRVGNEWYTSRRFLDDFFEGLNRYEPVLPGQRRKNLDRIEEELRRYNL
ncbi:MAG: DUF1580 domain-containing protein [Gemmataceae bacterium]